MRMTEKELESKLKIAIENTTPNVLERAKSSCRDLSDTPGKTLNTKRTWRFIAAAAAAVFLLALGAVIGMVIRNAPDNKVFATVSIDVNPSLEIKINKEEKVLDVIPLNDDAEKVIGDMDFSGSGVELAVNALIGSMYRLGYLNSGSNSVLVSLSNEDALKTGDLLDRLTVEISDMLEGSGSNVAAGISGNKRNTDDLPDNQIPSSRGALISKLLEQDASWNDFRIWMMSMEDLRLLVMLNSTVNSHFEQSNLLENQTSIRAAFSEALGHASIESSIEIVKAEFNGNYWLITTAASTNGMPDVRIKTAFVHNSVIYYIEFSTQRHDYFIALDSDQTVGRRVGYTSECTVENPILEANIPQNSGKRHFIGPDTAARAALQSQNVRYDELEYPLTAELLTDEDGSAYYAVCFTVSGIERIVAINSDSGAVIGCN